jgi:hypothetical protein
MIQNTVPPSILLKNGMIVCDGETAPAKGDLLIVGDVVADVGTSINPPPNCTV